VADAETNNEVRSLEQRIAELEKSELRYRSIFESSPVSLWEEDWSDIKSRLNEIVASGVTDLDAYFRSHLDEVIACVRMVKILDVNQATLVLCRAGNKDQILTGLATIFNEATITTFARELVAIGHDATSYEEETVVCTLDGEPRDVMFRLVVSAECERTWERCLVSLVDITDRKRAERALYRSKEETILAQRSALMKLSTPVIPISDQVIVMPLIGALDTARMQEIMSALLEELQRRRANIAILDVTGVPEIDAEATQGIVRAAQAVRLLGGQAVLTGIRPEVARRLVDLGSDLQAIVTRGTLQAGIAYAMHDRGAGR
jgi:rsbT co-antagonist protein RsbR